MAEGVLKLPILNWEIPIPKKWDLAPLALVVVGVALTGANLTASGVREPGAAISTGLTLVFFLLQLGVCLGSLMLLGKTAKEGTIHGNLLSLLGTGVGLMGIMLAAALWAAA